MKILIIDDEPATVEMLSTFFEINGYVTVGAYTGTDGLLLLEVEKPDVILLDLMMPDMVGYEVCKRLRAREAYATLPVLFISARTDREAIDEAYAVGANGYIIKPPNLMHLLGEVQRALNPS
jgi:DNA-binding response OmpR family regulator